MLDEIDYQNCKIVDRYDERCSVCKKDFYINKTDHLCYSNEEFGPFYKCEQTDISGNECAWCKEGYYYSYNNHICSKFEGCKLLKDENTCIECEEYYCLDVKNGSCVDNNLNIDPDNLFLFWMS